VVGSVVTEAQETPAVTALLACKNVPLVPTGTLATVPAALADSKSPFASKRSISSAVVRSNAVKVIISKTSLAANAGLRDAIDVPLVAV